MLVVRGDPGIGKSTLVAAALSEVDAAIVVGQAVPGAARPGRPLAEIVVAAVAMGASVGDPALGLFRRPVLALIDAAPTIPESIGDPTVFGPYPAAVGEGLLRLLTGAAARPVAVIEDLQWADPDTLAVVEYIAGHINGRPMALVVTHRPGENADADAVIGRLGRNSWATCLDLAALARDAVHEMIRVRVQGGRPPAELVAEVAGFAEGVPLLVEEFLTAALEDDSLRSGGDGDWQYTAARRPRPPESLRDSVEARVGRLGRIGRRTLLAGALLGRTFDVGLVARGLHLDGSTVAEAVRGAARAGLIRFGPGPDQAEFRHALIRDAIDAMLVAPGGSSSPATCWPRCRRAAGTPPRRGSAWRPHSPGTAGIPTWRPRTICGPGGTRSPGARSIPVPSWSRRRSRSPRTPRWRSPRGSPWSTPGP